MGNTHSPNTSKVYKLKMESYFAVYKNSNFGAMLTETQPKLIIIIKNSSISFNKWISFCILMFKQFWLLFTQKNCKTKIGKIWKYQNISKCHFPRIHFLFNIFKSICPRKMNVY